MPVTVIQSALHRQSSRRDPFLQVFSALRMSAVRIQPVPVGGRALLALYQGACKRFSISAAKDLPAGSAMELKACTVRPSREIRYL